MVSSPRNAAAPNDAEYGSEVLCAGWNPLAAALAEPPGAACVVGEEPNADDKAFLARVYRFQQV